MISLIWAMDQNWLIGDKNRLPWHYKEDLQYFKEKTQGKTVLMGEQTYLSLKGYYREKKLPFGKIYVASLDKKYEDVINIDNVVDFLNNPFDEEIFVIGGKTIYELALPFASRLYITHIEGIFQGDTYLKPFDLNAFKQISSKQSKNLKFCVYERMN